VRLQNSKEDAMSDPIAGTWKLNIAKSKVLHNGLKCIYDGVAADGRSYHMEFSAQYDGKDYPFTGGSFIDAVSAKKLDASTLELVCKKDGKEVMWPRLSVSNDGKLLTDTVKGMVQGQEFTATWIYEKQ
jgi:hypothetical protein